MSRMILLFALLGAASVTPFSVEAQSSIVLKSDSIDLPDRGVMFPGPGSDVVNNNCLACHSADHVLYQPLLSRENWAEVVHKMVTAYKAPISPDDEKQIVEYLAKTKSIPDR